MDSQSLIKGLREHDKITIRYIFDKFFPMIEHLVKTNGKGNRQDAEDLFMNALEAIYLKVEDDSFELSCAFSTLLFEICKRQWLKALKRKKRISGVTIGYQKELIEEDFVQSIEQSERYQLYREKFQELTEGCREVLSMALEHIPMREIAEKMGFASEEYARKRKFKCKEKLMQLVRADARYQELTNYGQRRKT